MINLIIKTLPFLMILLANLACKPTAMAVLATTPVSLHRTDLNSSQEILDYGDFAQFIDGGRKFRSDFIEAYSKSWQVTIFNETDHKRPGIQGFETIFDVYESYAIGTRFGNPREFQKFFHELAAIGIRDYDSKMAEIHENIRHIYRKEVTAATEVRLLGLFKDMVDGEEPFNEVIQNRVNEITGAKATKVDQHVIEFFDRAANLAHLRLSLEYLRKMIQSLDRAEPDDKTIPILMQKLAVLVRTYSFVAEKRNFKDCDGLQVHVDKQEQAVIAQINEICLESAEILRTINQAQSDLVSEKYNKLLDVLQGSLVSIERLASTIDRWLKELGLPAPMAT